MSNLWHPEQRYRVMAMVESLAAHAMADYGVIPVSAGKNLQAPVVIDPARVDEIEKTTHHDVIAFLTAMSEQLGPDGRYLHQGMTSSDLLDTTFAIQIRAAIDLLVVGVDKTLSALRSLVVLHRDTPCMGRSHGIMAEPTTFGLKMLVHHQAFTRHRRRLLDARSTIAVGAISGPVGTFSTVDPRIEGAVMARLALGVEPVSTQVIPRDRHALVMMTIAGLATAIEHIALEVRHLQRSEVAEVSEPFGKNQKGSSAMPHKRNPVLSENLTGLARMIRAGVAPCLENVALWHERDISHSSVERVMFPDAFIMADFALHRLATLLQGIVVDVDQMRENITRSQGLFAAGPLLNALTQHGLSREDAYTCVQSCAFTAWQERRPFVDVVRTNSTIAPLLENPQVSHIFNLGYYIRKRAYIVSRVLGDEAAVG